MTHKTPLLNVFNIVFFFLPNYLNLIKDSFCTASAIIYTKVRYIFLMNDLIIQLSTLAYVKKLLKNE